MDRLKISARSEKPFESIAPCPYDSGFPSSLETELHLPGLLVAQPTVVELVPVRLQLSGRQRGYMNVSAFTCVCLRADPRVPILKVESTQYLQNPSLGCIHSIIELHFKVF